LRQFNFRTGEVLPFVFTANQLGQSLFAPPNVKGWPGGEAWINSTRLLARKAFLERLFRAMMAIQFDSGRWLAQFRPGDGVTPERVLLATGPAGAAPALQGMDLI